MRNILRYIVIEWKLLGRGLMFWILLAALGAIYYLFASGDYYAQDIGRQSMVDAMFLFPAMLFAMLLTVASVRRDQASNHDRLVESLPYESSQLHIARMLAYAIPFTIIGWIPGLIFIIRMASAGIAITDHWLGLLVHLSSCIPFWFMIAVAYIIARITRQRISYLIAIIVFIFLSYIMEMLRSAMPKSSWLRLLDFTALDFFKFELYLGATGFSHDQTFVFQRLLYIGISLFLATTAIHLARISRAEKRNIAFFGATAIIAIALIVTSATQAVGGWNNRYKAVQSEVDWYKQSYEKSIFDIDFNPILSERAKQWQQWESTYNDREAVSYHLDAAITGTDEIEGFTHITLSAGTAEDHRVAFTLHHLFEVTDVQLMGNSVPFEREPDSDLLWITPPPELSNALIVTIAYRGKLDGWIAGSMPNIELPVRHAHVDSRSLLLPENYAWYPIPGVHKIAEYGEINVWDGGKETVKGYLKPLHFDPGYTNYVVNLTVPHGYKVYSNGKVTEREEYGKRVVQIEAEHAHGVSVAGGPLQRIAAPSGQYVSLLWNDLVKRDVLEAVRSKFDHLYTETLSILAELGGGEERKPTPVTIASLGGGGSVLAGSEMQLFNVQAYSRITRWDYENYVRTLFKQYEPLGEYQYEGPFFRFLAAYIEHHGGEKPAEIFEEEDTLVGGRPDPNYTMLNRIYQQYGDAELRVFITELWQTLKQSREYMQGKETVAALLAKWAGE